MINNEDLEKKMEECFELFIKYVCNNEVNIDLQRYFNKYAYGDIIDDKPNGRWFIISKKKKISAIFNFTNGILDGDVICYDPSTQCIDVHETYKNGKKIKEKRYYQSIYIGRRNIQKKSKYYKFFPGDC